jgi:Fe-S cluster assembly ATP-binding protein
MGILEVKDLTLTIEDADILKNITIDFWEGHIHAIVGPNGAGKSTLAKAIMGLEGYKEYTGDVLLEGESIKNMSITERAKRGITLAWQEPARFTGIPVQTFIHSAIQGDGNGELVDKSLDMVGLSPERYKHRAVDETLSGGERKRIELASIIAMRPKIMLMDEPDSGVDIDAVNNIFSVIHTLKDEGTTVILITHSSEVLAQADHGFLLCCGKLIDKGSVERLRTYFEGKCIPCDHKNQPELTGADE